MKLIYSLLCLAVLLSSCTKIASTKPNNDGLSFQTSYMGSFQNLCSNSDYQYLHINTRLVNDSDTTLEFVAYTCTTIANIIWDKEYIEPGVFACSGNYPVVLKLKPKHEFVMPIVLKCPRDRMTYPDSLKIGIVLISPREVNDFPDLISLLLTYRESFKNVLWSEPLCINSPRGPYEIRNMTDSVVYR